VSVSVALKGLLHELILPQRFLDPKSAANVLNQLKWIAATGSVRRLQLGTDVLAFAPYRVKQLEQKQRELSIAGASDKEQLTAAQEKIGLLEQQLVEKSIRRRVGPICLGSGRACRSRRNAGEGIRIPHPAT
jgi:hypothetical protein